MQRNNYRYNICKNIHKRTASSASSDIDRRQALKDVNEKKKMSKEGLPTTFNKDVQVFCADL